MALIRLRDISKTYPDGTRALRSVSFGIEEGEFIAIMGPSGSGKSTLLHIVGLLDRPTEGSYEFEGSDVSSFTDEQLARIRNERIGFVFQSFNLLARTSVLENVKLPLAYSTVPQKEWDERARGAIEAVGLSDRASHEPAMLSGGERQRVAIARALVMNPAIIFADEPTGNLDSRSGQRVMEIIQDLHERQGRTVVLITHETATAQHAQRILYVRDGQLERDEKVINRLRAQEAFVK
jgi:putative ABC transport system ATP-binding protein